MLNEKQLEIEPEAILISDLAHLGEPETYDDNHDDVIGKVIFAVKNQDYSVLEKVFAELGGNIDIDTREKHGNTLLILACQRGDKKLAKFLLRRGASMNLQNHSGNTCLHYLNAYRHVDLAEYLIGKGADDRILNADGLTCYEGSSKSKADMLNLY